MKNRVIPMFVYGTLMKDTALERLQVAPEGTEKAVLEGYRKDGLNIVPTGLGAVYGHYFLINDAELGTLDHYESVDSEYGYHRFLINVETKEGFKRAYAYQVKGTEK